MKETDIQKQVQLCATAHGHRLFRNNVGALRDANGRLVRYGLGVGTADLIGWTRDGRFLAVECKRPNAHTRADRYEAQMRFIAAVNAAGGVAGMVSSVTEAEALFT